MTTINQRAVIEKYDEASRLETHAERRDFLGQQSLEMKMALWLENIARKTQGKELSAEQKEIIETIKRKFITVEFVESVKGKTEAEAGPEYLETMARASELLGPAMLRDLLVVLGDNSTLKTLY